MFRDERDTLRARAEAAEAELAEVRRENERLRAEQERLRADASREDEPPPEPPPLQTPAERAVDSARRREALSGALALRVGILAVVLVASSAGLAHLSTTNPAEGVIGIAVVAGEVTVFAAFEVARVWLERRDETWWALDAIKFRVLRAALTVAVAGAGAWAGTARGAHGLVVGSLTAGFVALCVAIAAFAMPEDMTW